MKKLIKKAKIICFLCILSLMMCFFIFSLSACQNDKKDKTLDLNNYPKYIDINTNANSSPSGGTLRRCNGLVTIKKRYDVYNVTLQNVKITYTVSAGDFEESVSESLGSLNQTYSKRIEFNIEYSGDDIFYYPPVSINVSEISGDITTEEDPFPSYITFIIFGGMVLIVCAIAIPYHIRLVRRVKSIVAGMTYSEVINILGEPDESKSAEEITTCNWQQRVRRGGLRTYCTVTFKKGKVISVIHRWQSDF